MFFLPHMFRQSFGILSVVNNLVEGKQMCERTQLLVLISQNSLTHALKIIKIKIIILFLCILLCIFSSCYFNRDLVTYSFLDSFHCGGYDFACYFLFYS